MLATGKVEVITGTSPHGQGHETAWSQIVADRLGVPFEDVEVLHGDTQIAPKGLDTYGSRSLVVGGEALVKAADKVIEKAKPFAAHLLEAGVDDLEFSAGRFTVKGTDKGVTIAEVALATFDRPQPARRRGAEPRRRRDVRPYNFSFPHGTHLCAMEVDTETGRLARCAATSAVDDIGKIINPLIVAGQEHGGIVQGIAQALWEGAEYDENGTLVTGSFVDYTLPTAADTISFVIDNTVTSPRRRTPWEPRASVRPACIASTPAVVNAIVDAVRHLGVNDVQMPCTPERVWKAIQTAGAALRRRDRGGAAALRGRLPQPGPLGGRDGRSGTVIPAAFDYLAPTTVDEALAALAAGGDDAKVMGGGQSLLPILRMRLNAPDTLVDLGRIEALRGIRDAGDHLVIGAMTPYSDLLESDLVHEHAALLAKAVAEVADPQIRHRGTIGGALVHADPAGDVGAPVLALDAELVIVGAGGERTVPASEFFHDLFETSVAEGELLTEVRIPKHTGWGSHYEKFVRVSHQWSIVGDRGGREGRGRHDQRGPHRADQHGQHPAARPWRGAGPGRPVRRRPRRRLRRGGRRHQPAERPQRRRRLPAPPRDGCSPVAPSSPPSEADHRMELTHDFTVPASVDDAWATFMDLERVGSCFPGAMVTSVDESGFAGTVKVKLGPIALQYAGTGQFLERDDAAHRAVIEAKGKDKRGNGTAGATVTVQLAPSGEGTRIDVTTDLSITGKPAQFGRGVMQDVSDKLLQQFVACIERQFAEPETASDAGAAAGCRCRGRRRARRPPPRSVDLGRPGRRWPLAPAAGNAVGGRPAPAPRPLRPAPAAADDSIDLGATVLPVLVKNYAPYAVAALAGLVLGWLIGRRNS